MDEVDVAIIGGGPGGSTLSTLIKKYRPETNVIVLESEVFPREHVGESQLPLIGQVLDEMGVWDKIEAANFPIKIGATYRWGTSEDLWDFEFIPGKRFEKHPRPAPYEGQRRQTAFQVERATYDKILLDHAKETGVDVREGTPVKSVKTEGDAVESLVLESGDEIRAKVYVDASGNKAILRRALRVPTDEPTKLKNIAFWSYWDNAEWAVTIGDEATRVNVMSIGFGWIWFIPISKTRASVGLVMPAEVYKSLGKSPESVYLESVRNEKTIAGLLRHADRDGSVHGTKDWSFVSQRMAGPNWFLVGEAAGFADPILAAGLTLTHVAAKELSCVINSILDQDHDSEWLRRTYEEIQIRRIRQHIRFADYWYTANEHFTDLKSFTSEIAKDSGLELSPDEAFQWLGTGGFVNDDWRTARIATFSLGSAKELTQFLGSGKSTWQIQGATHFRADYRDAERQRIPAYHHGKVIQRECLCRGLKKLPLIGQFGNLLAFLEQTRTADELKSYIAALASGDQAKSTNAIEALEAMVSDGWVKVKRLTREKPLELNLEAESEYLHFNRDQVAERNLAQSEPENEPVGR